MYMYPFLNRLYQRKKGETVKMYVSCVHQEIILLPLYQYFVHVVVLVSSAVYFTTTQQMKVVHKIAFVTHATRTLKLGISNSRVFLFPRQHSIKKRMMRKLKNR